MGLSARILVIDSEAEFVRQARRALETARGNSFQVSVATTAREGIERATKDNPDAIVLGYLAPRGASFQCHQELHDNPLTKEIPLLIVDVRPEDHARKGWKLHEGLRMSAQDYLSRPIEGQELVSAVQRTIRRASGEPMGLREASEHMERALARIDRIEELLVG